MSDRDTLQLRKVPPEVLAERLGPDRLKEALELATGKRVLLLTLPINCPGPGHWLGDVSVRLAKLLERNMIKSVDELCTLRPRDVARWRGMGRVTWNELGRHLHANALFDGHNAWWADWERLAAK